MKIAVIEDGSEQVIVKEGQEISLAYRSGLKENEQLSVNKVLLIKDDSSVKIGSPYVENSEVKLSLIKHYKDKKVRVFKFKHKTTYRRNKGHRQNYSLFKVAQIV